MAMKRSKPLNRQSSAIRRKVRLSRQGAKAGVDAAELEAMRPLVMARSHGLCEVCRSRPVEVPHHRKRRSQGGTNGLANLLGLCTSCHDGIHAEPAWAYSRGFLLRRDDLETPMQHERRNNA
jgi:5-methylcytosine-specific restriction endonuclease McrA